MTQQHGDKAFYCKVEGRYVLGRTPEGDCPFCGEDLTEERYERMMDNVRQHQNE